MSSFALLPFLLVAPAMEQGPPITAEQAIETYRGVFAHVVQPRCPPPSYPGELVVCAPKPQALPLPVEPEPGERTRMLPGEAPRADAGRTAGYCFSQCPGTVGLDLGTAIKIVNGIRKAIEETSLPD